MIDFKNVSLKYGKSLALEHVSFQIPAKSYVVIEGPSGAGKSSLLRLLASFEVPTKGEVTVTGKAMSKLSRAARSHYRRSVGYMGNDVTLLPNRTCFENIALPMQIAGNDSKEVQARVSAALARVGLAKAGKLYPDALSGGEQQRVAIARAIVNRPQLLLADEPTAQLDGPAADKIAQLFREFNQANVTIVLATHDPERFKGWSHRMHLSGGQLESLDTRGAEQ
jgi:cell division transport system ATP-binding protein